MEFENPEKAAEGARAIVIVTEWDLFKTYDYDHFYTVMEQPSHIFDGRNLLDEEKMAESKFNYHRIGRRFDWWTYNNIIVEKCSNLCFEIEFIFG